MHRSPALYSRNNGLHLERPGLVLFVSHPLAYCQDHQKGVLLLP